MSHDAVHEPNDQMNIQRCVDGELSESDQRSLFGQCETTPAMWRALALAFVENQVWDDAVLDADIYAPAPRSVPKTSAGKWTHLKRIRLFSIAAGLVLCLALGIVVGKRISVQPDNREPTVAGEDQTKDKGADQEKESEVLWLAVDSPDRQYRQTLRIPILQATEEARTELMKAPDLVRDDVARHLRAAGYEIRQRRHFVPLGLRDGRRVILPVDNVELHSVDNSDFQ